MPDTWFEALIVAGLAILLWPAARPQPEGVVPPAAGAGPSWRRVVAAGVVLGTSATVAQVGEALILPAVIYLLPPGRGRRRAVGQAAPPGPALAPPIVALLARP